MRDQRERNGGASMLTNKREMQLKRNCRERRNRKRESSSPLVAERKETAVVQCLVALSSSLI